MRRPGNGRRAGRPLCALHLQPQSARDADRHAAARLHRPRPRRSHASGRDDRDRRLGRFAEAITQEIFGDEIGWLPWRRPGFELGLRLQRFAAEESRKRRARCSRRMACSPGADTQRECYRDHARHDQQRHPPSRRSSPQAKRPSAARRSTPLDAARSARRIAAALMPRLRRPRLEDAASEDRPFRRQRDRARFRRSRRSRRARGAWHLLPRPFPAHEDLAAGAALRSGARKSSTTSCARLEPAIEAYRGGYAGYYDRCKRADSPTMRDPTRSSISFPASA